MTTATVYATLVTDAYVDGLITRLVRLGYSVSPINGEVVTPGPASALAIFDISREIGDEDYEELEGDDLDERDVVLADVTSSLNEMGARWHSIIVQVEGHTCWEHSNIEPLPAPAPEPPVSPLLSEEPFG